MLLSINDSEFPSFNKKCKSNTKIKKGEIGRTNGSNLCMHVVRKFLFVSYAYKI